MKSPAITKQELFANAPIHTALRTMAIPTIISQLINLIYNMVDAFFIGRTGNSYMTAATTVTLTLVMFNVAVSNLFGIGGGSLVARLMGRNDNAKAKQASSFGVYASILTAVVYSLLVFVFMDPLLRFLGGSEATMDFAKSYTLIVVVIGGVPAILSLTLAHMLRNVGLSTQASVGLSLGGVLNVILDPLFMFVIMSPGQEVTGAAIATAISNFVACCYLLTTYIRSCRNSPISLKLRDALSLDRLNRRSLFAVGIPSAVLTGLFDAANICVNILASAHNDFVLAGMGIVMKIERIPNAVNIGICQGMLPLVAFNYSAGNSERMRRFISSARNIGIVVSLASILLFELTADPASRIFMNTSVTDVDGAMKTVAFAALFLRIRCIASPLQFINYHTSFCMQAMGFGKETMLHAFVRELVFYIPFMFILDSAFGEIGLASALPVGEGCGAVFAMMLLYRVLKRSASKETA